MSVLEARTSRILYDAGGCENDLRDYCPELFIRDRPFPKQHRRFGRAVHDGRLEADLGCVALQNTIHTTVEILEDCLPRRRAWLPRQIRRGRDERHPACA